MERPQGPSPQVSEDTCQSSDQFPCLGLYVVIGLCSLNLVLYIPVGFLFVLCVPMVFHLVLVILAPLGATFIHLFCFFPISAIFTMAAIYLYSLTFLFTF